MSTTWSRCAGTRPPGEAGRGGLSNRAGRHIGRTGLRNGHGSGGGCGMKLGLMAICFAVFVVSGALAQQKKAVPPPPKPADDGPNLEVTMKFIQDKVNDVGALNYAAYGHDNAAGNDWTTQFKVEATNVVANASACRITYHWKTSVNGKDNPEGEAGIVLNSVVDVTV